MRGNVSAIGRRRLAWLVALLGAAVVALLPGEVADAAPVVGVRVSTSCQPGEVCGGVVAFTPPTNGVTDAWVACSAATLPTVRVDQTGVVCGLFGADGSNRFSMERLADRSGPALLAGLATNLPLQSYTLCIVGEWEIGGFTYRGSPICTTSNAPPV